MKVVDLHPEELLDKDARGDLSADERVRLEVHLERCAACRAERVLRADFSAEMESEDRDSAVLGLVQGALAAPRPVAAPLPRPDPIPEEVVAGLPRRRPLRTAVVLLVAAAVLAASAAGATGVTGRVWLRIRGGSQETTHASAMAATPAPPSAAVLVTVAHAPPAPPPAEVAASPDPTPLLPVAFAAAPAPAPALSSAPSTPAAVTASSLFDSANAARRDGDTASALARYDALERRFPGTREARVARATTAKLLLDRGDPAGALARFDAYLASGSTELREEAMAGRATALERLGRDEDESRAWAALLATYPRTPYAAHARARVGRSLPQ